MSKAALAGRRGTLDRLRRAGEGPGGVQGQVGLRFRPPGSGWPRGTYQLTTERDSLLIYEHPPAQDSIPGSA
jgi:hypothetical protein